MKSENSLCPPRHPVGPVTCSICSIQELLQCIQEAMRTSQGLVINPVNAHIFNLCWTNPELRTWINQSDIVPADGMAIVWAARFLGCRMKERCNMTDAFRAYLADNSLPPATAILIGCTDTEAGLAAAYIQARAPHLQIIAAVSGYLPTNQYAEKLSRLPECDFIFLGMGTPKTEELSAQLQDIRPNTIIWHIGGGTLLFLSQKRVEAPKWMRKMGLQWLHRLVQEPTRMWRRYLIGNPLFVLRILKTRLRP